MPAERSLLVVSNRLPVQVRRTSQGFEYLPAPGGLVTALEGARQRVEPRWLGWPGIYVEREDERASIASHLAKDYDATPLFVPEALFDAYYEGFSNGTLWPLFHYFPQHAHYEEDEWNAYREVNRRFCDRIVEIAPPDARVWVHDYHLLLLPELLREALPKARIGFFLHIPFPSSEIFRMLPWREQLLRGLLGADVIGFHSHAYARHFQSSLLRLLGLEHEFGRVWVGDRLVRIDSFPLGVDVARLGAAREDPEVEAERLSLLAENPGKRIVLTVDRLDFTKGIPERLRAFERFLERNPHWHEKVTLIALTVPSRTGVPEYQALKREVDELVGRVNGRFGESGWTPILYLYRNLPFERLVALYRAADELGEALIVNPHDEEQVCRALERALEMPEDEQRRRNRGLLERQRRYDVGRWVEDFLTQLEPARLEGRGHEPLEGAALEALLDAHRASERRLLLLDYDGTMVPFAPRPEEAAPDPPLLDLLRSLSANPRNTVVIISGRDRATLEAWLGDVGADLVAEHGAVVRLRSDPTWRQSVGAAEASWKPKLRPLLELFVDRTPGAMIEEKAASLAWHYRQAPPDLGELRARQLAEGLEGMLSNSGLVVLQGSKVIEVKDGAIGKGRAAEPWLGREPRYDFVLATGDDPTDEEMFEVMPAEAWTILIGADRPSHARHRLAGPDAIRALLRSLA